MPTMTTTSKMPISTGPMLNGIASPYLALLARAPYDKSSSRPGQVSGLPGQARGAYEDRAALRSLREPYAGEMAESLAG